MTKAWACAHRCMGMKLDAQAAVIRQVKDSAIDRVLVSRIHQPELIIVIVRIARELRDFQDAALLSFVPDNNGVRIRRIREF